MCGITGIYAFNQIGSFYMINLAKATDRLNKRGPDGRGLFLDDIVGLGHRRLSIIDTSFNGNQPMSDESKRYVIIFNGEIFNYKELRKYLESNGVSFSSDSDTEVLLKLYINEGKKCLERLVGFFAFAIYDKEEKSLFIARDRLGIKPLYFYHDDDKFIFGSELKSIMAFNIEREINYEALLFYLQLNYIPGPDSILKNVVKLDPGSYLEVKKKDVKSHCYYTVYSGDALEKDTPQHYEQAKERLIQLMEEAVRLRLVSDVPLGAFLSGGIDSSVVVALASRNVEKLKTFSIGFKDEPFFDETMYANLVARKFNTDHTVFSLSNDDLFDHLFDMLDYLDEPFADSSALAVYILSKHTAGKVKVALSGDGADEIFGGYNKYMGEYKLRQGGALIEAATMMAPLWNILPKSRNGYISNKIRQLKRLADGNKLSKKDRYWLWCSFASQDQAKRLLSKDSIGAVSNEKYLKSKERYLKYFSTGNDINEVLRSDVDLVLANDMLVKVDRMSMANGLEVRVPFLDHRVVDFAFSLPGSFKVDGNLKKRVLQDAFRDVLPAELYNRPKHGFEVPLLKWLRRDLKSLINDDLLSDKFIHDQKIFNLNEVKLLKQQLFSNNPGDSHARIWGLLVFQHWYKKYLQN